MQVQIGHRQNGPFASLFLLLLSFTYSVHGSPTSIVASVTSTLTSVATTTPSTTTVQIATSTPTANPLNLNGASLSGVIRTKNTANLMDINGNVKQFNFVRTAGVLTMTNGVGITQGYSCPALLSCYPQQPQSRDTVWGPTSGGAMLEFTASDEELVAIDPSTGIASIWTNIYDIFTIKNIISSDTVDITAAMSASYVQVLDSQGNNAAYPLTDAFAIALGVPYGKSGQRYVFIARSSGYIDILVAQPQTTTTSFSVRPFGRINLNNYGFSQSISQIVWAADALHIFGNGNAYLQLSTVTWQNNNVIFPTNTINVVKYARGYVLNGNWMVLMVTNAGALYRWMPLQGCSIDYFSNSWQLTMPPIMIVEAGAMVLSNAQSAYYIDMANYAGNASLCGATATSTSAPGSISTPLSTPVTQGLSLSVSLGSISAGVSVGTKPDTSVLPATSTVSAATTTSAAKPLICGMNSTSSGMAYITAYQLKCSGIAVGGSVYLRIDDGVTVTTGSTLTNAAPSTSMTLPDGKQQNHQVYLRVYQPSGSLLIADTLIFNATIIVVPNTTPVSNLVSSLTTITDPVQQLDVIAAVSSNVATNTTAVNSTQMTTVMSTLNNVVSAQNVSATTVYRTINILSQLSSSSSNLTNQFGDTMIDILTTATTQSMTNFANSSQTMDPAACTQVLNIVSNIASSNVSLTTATSEAAFLSLTNAAYLALGKSNATQLASGNNKIQISIGQVTTQASMDTVSFANATLSNLNAAMTQIGMASGLARMMNVQYDLYAGQSNDTILARSGYVSFSLLDMNGNEVSVQNLASPLTLQIPITNTFNYDNANITALQPVCTFYNEIAASWDSTGCSYIAGASSASSAFCQCNHLTTFSIAFAKFSFAPNAIDSSLAGSLKSNYGILLVAAAFVVVWMSCIFLAMRFDRRNKLSAKTYGALASKTAPTLYQIDVVTGQQAFMSLTVSLQSNGITEYYRLLREMPAHTAQTFFVRGPEIGLLNGVSFLSHVASAEQNADGTLAAATIKSFQVIDCGSYVKYDFGAIELSVHGTAFATPNAVNVIEPSFMQRWRYLLRQNLPDRHSWVSIFLRHKGSVFTSAERTMICFLLLAANAACGLAWYHSADASGDNISATILYKICIGLITSVIVFIGTYPLVHLFRSARSFNAGPLNGNSEEKADLLSDPSMPLEDRWHVGWRALAWGIATFGILGCLVISVLYTNQLWQASEGKGVLRSWIQSFFISVIESLFISQPFTVMVMAGWRARTRGNSSKIAALLEQKKRDNFGTINARSSTLQLPPSDFIKEHREHEKTLTRKRPMVQTLRTATFGRQQSLLSPGSQSFMSLPRNGSAIFSPGSEQNSLSRNSDSDGSSTPLDTKQSF